jgi:uncharacterized delta-60 repeat protein
MTPSPSKPTTRAFSTVVVAVLFLGLCALPASAAGTAIGSLDPGFGTNGAARVVNPDADPSLTADLHVLGDGRILVLLPGAPTVVARYLADGTLDPSFGGDGRITLGGELRIDAMTVDGNGRVLLVGSRPAADDDLDVVVARLHPGGALDQDYGANGIARLTRPEMAERGCGAAISASGRLLVAAAGLDDRGTAEPDDDRSVATFMQLGNRGRLNATFGGDGIVRLRSTGARCDLFPQADGSIVFGGPPQGPGWFGSRCAVGRLFVDGTPDTNFHGDGVRGLVPSTGSATRCVTVVQPDGKIVAALRTAHSRKTGFDIELVRVRPGGSIDTSFGRRGRTRIDVLGSDDTPVALVADAGGITIGSTSAGLGRDHDVALTRLKDDGTIARAFGIQGRIAIDVGQSLGGAAGGDRILDVVEHVDGLAVLGIGPRPGRVRALLRLGPASLDPRRPTSRIGHPREGRTYGQLGVQTLRGSAADPLSGVARVEVAIRQSLTNGDCQWLGRRGGFAERACDRPQWLEAKGTLSWLFALPRVLPESVGSIKSYRAYARAVDGAGNVERRFQRGRNANTFEVRN